MFAPGEIRRTAVIDPTGRYRYRLTRQWGPESEGVGSTLMPFVMLNPSTADADVDDPTIRRCMGFARREGAHGITVVNLMAWRATKPKDLPVDLTTAFGPDNGSHILDVAETAGYIVAAWGAGGSYRARYFAPQVLGLLRDIGVSILCLGQTIAGHPRHPLYVAGDQPLVPFVDSL